MRDPYSVLGVRRDAGPDEIKAAWRSKAKSAHPDQNRDDPSATGRFAEIGQAYDILRDPKKRTRFDEKLKRHETGEQTFQQKRDEARQAAERAKAARLKAAEVLQELERAEAARRAEAAKGRSQTAAPGMETPEEVISRIFGVPPEQQPPLYGKAGGNADTGTASDETSEDKEARDSIAARSGSLPAQAMDLLASWMRRIRGVQPPADKAPDIYAVATVTVDDLMKLNWVKVQLGDERDGRFQIEPGAADGDVVRLRGQGLRLQGMQRGDVVVTLRVDPSGPFRAIGSDIHTVLPVNLQNAVLGSSAIADSPSGPVEVTIPAWTGSDQTIRLPGRGLPKADGGHGDLVVEIRLTLLEKPDAKITDLMRSMREGLYL